MFAYPFRKSRSVLGRSTLLVVLLLVGVCTGTVSAMTWQTETVDSAGDVGQYSCLALDSAGHPHISYFDFNPNYDLKYAKWTGSAWDIQTVDATGFVGQYSCLALDSAGRPHISYLDMMNYDLMYAKWTGSAWDIQTVDATGFVGIYRSLALDSAGNPHISYYNRTDVMNGDLKYAAWNGSAWEIETVDAEGNVGDYSSLALDSAGNPHISYQDGTNTALKYAAWNGSAWEIETVDSTDNVGAYTSLALDSAGNPCISYRKFIVTAVKYAEWTGSAWDIQTVDATGNVQGTTSLALDSAGNPRISYRDDTNGDLKYAARTGSVWDIQTVDAEDHVGGSPSLALDSDDNPHISYYDYTNLDLKYASGSNQLPVAAFTTNTTSGLPPLAVAFDASTSSDTDGTIVSYAWDFGDGSIGTGATVSHTYSIVGTYTVTLTVTDNDGATNTETATITAETQSPVALFTANPTSGEIPLTVALNATASSDPDGTIASYAWDFGDGSSDTGVTASHTYSTAGTYLVILTVTDNDGATATNTATITAEAPTSTPTPTASSPGTGGGGPNTDTGVGLSTDLKAGDTASLSMDKGAVYKIVFTAGRDISSIMVTVKATHSLPSSINATGTDDVYEYEQVTLYYTDDADLSWRAISFKISKSWLASKGYDSGDIVLMHYNEETGIWEELRTECIGEDGGYYYYSAETPSFSWFAVAISKGATVVTVVTSETNVTNETDAPLGAEETPETTLSPTNTIVPTESQPAASLPGILAPAAMAIALVGTGLWRRRQKK